MDTLEAGLEQLESRTSGSSPAQIDPLRFGATLRLAHDAAALAHRCIGSLVNQWQTYEANFPPPRTASRGEGPLSQREQHVLELIGNGLSNKQIALALDIAPETVKSHVKRIFAKLDVRSRTAAAMRARQRGLL